MKIALRSHEEEKKKIVLFYIKIFPLSQEIERYLCIITYPIDTESEKLLRNRIDNFLGIRETEVEIKLRR